MLVQLIYTSRLRFEASTPAGWSHMQDIVSRARERNARHEITGFIIVGNDWVAQILEGPRDQVLKTFMTILADHRHHSQMLVDIRNITERSFSDWSMGLSPRPHAEMPFGQRLSTPGSFSPVTFDVILTMAQIEAA